VLADAVWVVQDQGAEGLFPAVDASSLDQSCGCPALVGRPAFLLLTLPGAFVLDVADGQPEQLDHRVVGREMPAVLDDLAELEVERLDRVRGVDDLAELGRERQERSKPLQRVLPGRHRGRILGAKIGLSAAATF
jgi:hypothetical protein